MAVYVEIQLEDGPWTDRGLHHYWPAGGTIRGDVILRTDERPDCRGVRVAAGWRTEGRGDRDEGMVFASTLYEGTLDLGESRFPFAAELPHQPISYQGHYVSIVWRVSARVDLAWKSDPSAEEMFYMLPSAIDDSSL